MIFPSIYKDFIRKVAALGYERVERDDRLLDVLPECTREKGVELWEKQNEQEVFFIRVRLPYDAKNIQMFVMAREHLEKAFRKGIQLDLKDFRKPDQG